MTSGTDLHAQTVSSAWFGPDMTASKMEEVLDPDVLKFWEKRLEKQSEELAEIVNGIRKDLWDNRCTYPCVGCFGFLKVQIHRHFALDGILERMANPASRVVDLGCGIGQESAFLVHRGVQPDKAVPIDKSKAMVDMGNNVFGRNYANDSNQTIKLHEGDVSKLQEICGKNDVPDVVLCGLLLHLFDRPDQIQLGVDIIKYLLSKPADSCDKQSMIVGWQTETSKDGLFILGSAQAKLYGHVSSIKSMWMEIADKCEVEVEIEAKSKDAPRLMEELASGEELRVEGKKGLVYWLVKISVMKEG